MIKLIASDVDGTLVKDSSTEIYPEIIPVIRDLREKIKFIYLMARI